MRAAAPQVPQDQCEFKGRFTSIGVLPRKRCDQFFAHAPAHLYIASKCGRYRYVMHVWQLSAARMRAACRRGLAPEVLEDQFVAKNRPCAISYGPVLFRASLQHRIAPECFIPAHKGEPGANCGLVGHHHGNLAILTELKEPTLREETVLVAKHNGSAECCRGHLVLAIELWLYRYIQCNGTTSSYDTGKLPRAVPVVKHRAPIWELVLGAEEELERCTLGRGQGCQK